jgi:hypothetical protein
LRPAPLRANEHTDTNSALFEVYDDDRVIVLAVISATESIIDRVMTHNEARQVWRDLVAKGWHHATEDEIDQALITRGTFVARRLSTETLMLPRCVAFSAAWSLAARAQEPRRLPTVGFLGPNTRSVDSQRLAAFVERLRELGWIQLSGVRFGETPRYLVIPWAQSGRTAQ